MPRIDVNSAHPSANDGDPDARDVPQDAAHWFARMHSGEATPADRQGFAAWCAAHPSHEPDYRALVAQWHAARLLPEARLRDLMQAPPALSPSRHAARRRIAIGLASACTLTLVAGVLTASHVFEPAAEPVEFVTRKGERREVVLADGSVLHLNGETRLIATLGRRERRILLTHGEAFFAVAHDATRPFVVEGGAGRVTVTGTRFNVRHDSDTLQVSVESGSVRLDTGPWWRAIERRLTAGQQADAYADQTLSSVTQVNVEHLAAWQRGKIVFNDAPLSTVVREMNRYLLQSARLASPELGYYRISGVFSVDDPLAMFDALPAIAPVRINRRANGNLWVVAR